MLRRPSLFRVFRRKFQLPPNVTFSSEIEKEKAIKKLKTGGYSLLGFTCTHKSEDFKCLQSDENRRSFKTISKKSYSEGVVLVKCKCEKLHLIADNLGWFGDEPNIEEIMKNKNEEITKLTIDQKFTLA